VLGWECSRGLWTSIFGPPGYRIEGQFGAIRVLDRVVAMRGSDLVLGAMAEEHDGERGGWLRRVTSGTGLFTRLFVYACLFGALFIFRPEGLSEGWIATRPLAALTLGDIAAAVGWLAIAFFLIRALFKPDDAAKEAWGYFGFVLVVVLLLTTGGLFLYAHWS
jgi:hypothetical protein